MTAIPPTPDNPARRSPDPAYSTDIFIDDEPGNDQPPATRPVEGRPCVP